MELFLLEIYFRKIWRENWYLFPFHSKSLTFLTFLPIQSIRISILNPTPCTSFKSFELQFVFVRVHNYYTSLRDTLFVKIPLKNRIIRKRLAIIQRRSSLPRIRGKEEAGATRNVGAEWRLIFREFLEVVLSLSLSPLFIGGFASKARTVRKLFPRPA